MTLREEIQAKIDAIESKAAADVAPLKAELAIPGSHLDAVWDDFKTRVDAVLAEIRGAVEGK